MLKSSLLSRSLHIALSAFVLVMVTASTAGAQEPSQAEIKQQAESQLQTMSPQQIDGKIREYGLTRSEADAKAKELGIDLETYMQGYGQSPAPTEPSALVKTDTPVVTQSKSSVNTQPLIKKISPPETVDLELFGQQFFKSGNANFEPSPSFSEKEYVVGAGDVLRLSLWGTTEMTNEFTVDKDGRILIPTVGPIMIAGLIFDDAKKKILFAMSKSYAGLTEIPPKIFMDVSLSKLRPIRVMMMGEVEQPGGYFVNNFGNVFNSLYAVGGPKASGTMRDIRVIRNNKQIARVDLYDYLVASTKTNDLRINENDIIFVPLRGKTVAIKGRIPRAGKFELLPGENLKKLIEFAGGIRTDVFNERIQVDRIIPFSERVKGGAERKLMDVEFEEIVTGKKDLVLEDGDIITIMPILDLRMNVVSVAGAVARPGTYQIEKLKTVKDLIGAANGLMKTAYLHRAEMVRTYANFRQELIPIDVKKAMENDPVHNLPLQSLDALRIYTLDEVLGGPNTVTIEGRSKITGVMPLYINLSLYELVLHNVGLTDSLFRKSVFMDRADLIRKNLDNQSTRIVPFDLHALFERKEGDTLMLPGDRVIIYPNDAVGFNTSNVEIYGKVKRPAVYPLSQSMSLVDLLLQAGGYTEDASVFMAEVTRVGQATLGEDSLVHVLFTELPDLFDTTRAKIDILNSSTAKRFLLRNRDKVFIRPNPDYYQPRGVIIRGQVKFAGTYMLSKRNERLSDLIGRAGGVSPDGYARGIRVIRDGVSLRLNAELAIDDPEGRDDIILQTNDEIVVPFKPNTVQVTGEVQNPGTYGFLSGEDTDFYLNRAGGVTDSADFVLVTYPEGYVFRANTGVFSGSPEIYDGSRIHVVKIPPPPPPDPINPNEESFFDSWKDILALLSSTITVLVLAKNL